MLHEVSRNPDCVSHFAALSGKRNKLSADVGVAESEIPHNFPRDVSTFLIHTKGLNLRERVRFNNRNEAIVASSEGIAATPPEWEQQISEK